MTRLRPDLSRTLQSRYAYLPYSTLCSFVTASSMSSRKPQVDGPPFMEGSTTRKHALPIIPSRKRDDNVPKTKDEGSRSVLTRFLHSWARNKRDNCRNLFSKERLGQSVPCRCQHPKMRLPGQLSLKSYICGLEINRTTPGIFSQSYERLGPSVRHCSFSEGGRKTANTRT